MTAAANNPEQAAPCGPSHRRADGHGRPLVILATRWQRHEVTLLAALPDAGAVKRSGPMGGRGEASRGWPRDAGSPSAPGETRARCLRRGPVA
jgi:hypothetical protein